VRFQRRGQNIHAGERRQIEIDEHNVELPALDEIDCLVAASSSCDVVPIELQDTQTAFAERSIVIDQQEAKTCLYLRGDRELPIARVYLASGRT
jgi:hypothetical protein